MLLHLMIDQTRIPAITLLALLVLTLRWLQPRLALHAIDRRSGTPTRLAERRTRTSGYFCRIAITTASIIISARLPTHLVVYALSLARETGCRTCEYVRHITITTHAAARILLLVIRWLSGARATIARKSPTGSAITAGSQLLLRKSSYVCGRR